jgi:hypothetical protein
MKQMNFWNSRMITMRKILIGLLLLSLIIAGCAMYKASLRTTYTIGATEPAGKYTLIKYGGNGLEDYLTFALIVPEGSDFKFEIYKPSFEFRSITGLTAKQAFEMARIFVAAHPEFASSQTRGILSPDDKIIAYEIRPLYKTTVFGQSDVMFIFYLLKEHNVVEVRADLEEQIKDKLRGGGGDRDGGK